jgi:hypothetical protein
MQKTKLKSKHETREQWLETAVRLMEPLFKNKGYEVPGVRVSCGFPSKGALAMKKPSIGECWYKESTVDGIAQLFISPFLRDHVEVIGTLVHEVVHAVCGAKAKHGAQFKKCAVAVGLEGKMTATVAGKELIEMIEGWMKDLGAYPHQGLKPGTKPEEKQTTRMVKCECEECGYAVRTSRKWLDEAGAPLCPCNKKPMAFEIPPELENEDEDEDDD